MREHRKAGGKCSFSWTMTNCWYCVCCLLHFTCSTSLLKSELRWVKQSLWDVTAADASFCVCRWLSFLWGSFFCDSGTEICVSTQHRQQKVDGNLTATFLKQNLNTRWCLPLIKPIKNKFKCPFMLLKPFFFFTIRRHCKLVRPQGPS